MGIVRTEFRHPFRPRGTPNAYADPGDLDGLLGMLNAVKEEIESLRELEYDLRSHLGVLAVFENKKTAHIRGTEFSAEVTKPKAYFDQSSLKQIVQGYPEYSMDFIRVATYAPNMVAVNKLRREVGSDRFNEFRDELLNAERTSTSPPTVKLKKRSV